MLEPDAEETEGETCAETETGERERDILITASLLQFQDVPYLPPSPMFFLFRPQRFQKPPPSTLQSHLLERSWVSGGEQGTKTHEAVLCKHKAVGSGVCLSRRGRQ